MALKQKKPMLRRERYSDLADRLGDAQVELEDLEERIRRLQNKAVESEQEQLVGQRWKITINRSRNELFKADEVKREMGEKWYRKRCLIMPNYSFRRSRVSKDTDTDDAKERRRLVE